MTVGDGGEAGTAPAVTGDGASGSRDGQANPDERRFAPFADGMGPAIAVAVAVLAPAYAPRRPTETVLYRPPAPSSPFSRTPASTTRAGCPGTSSRSCART